MTVTMNDEFGSKWKKEVVAYFNVLSQHLQSKFIY